MYVCPGSFIDSLVIECVRVCGGGEFGENILAAFYYCLFETSFYSASQLVTLGHDVVYFFLG